MNEMRPRGEMSKCPACGSGVDEDAYRCPKCRIYFCYKCRARVGKKEEQFQCAEQSCRCYGKLLCSACTVLIPKEGPVTRPTFGTDNDENVAAGVFWAGAILGVITGIIAGCSGADLRNAIGIGFGVAVVVWVIAGIRANHTTTTMETIATPRCCIQCRHAVKHL